jgi:hypothetical protein
VRSDPIVAADSNAAHPSKADDDIKVCVDQLNGLTDHAFQ